jgi:hypothetical protein
MTDVAAAWPPAPIRIAPKRCFPDRFAGQFGGAAQVFEIDLAESHEAQAYGPARLSAGGLRAAVWSADDNQCLGGGDRLRHARQDGSDLQRLEDSLPADACLT